MFSACCFCTRSKILHQRQLWHTAWRVRKSPTCANKFSNNAKQQWSRKSKSNAWTENDFPGASSPTAQYVRRLYKGAKGLLVDSWRRSRFLTLAELRSYFPQSRQELFGVVKEQVYRLDDILRLACARIVQAVTNKQWWRRLFTSLRKENVAKFYGATPFEMVYHVLLLQTIIWFLWWCSHRLFHSSTGERAGFLGFMGKNFALSLHGFSDGRVWTACVNSLLNIDLLTLVGNGTFVLLFGLNCVNVAGPWHFLSLFFSSTIMSSLAYFFVGSLAYLRAQIADSNSTDELFNHGVWGPAPAINARKSSQRYYCQNPCAALFSFW